MEKIPMSEAPDFNPDLARLKDIADGLLKPDVNDPKRKIGFQGLFFVKYQAGEYELTFGEKRILKIGFNRLMGSVTAEVEWYEGNPDYYEDEYEPIKRWREKNGLKAGASNKPKARIFSVLETKTLP